MKCRLYFPQILGCAAALALPLAGAVAAYPDHPIHVLVGSAAGGGTDTSARRGSKNGV